MSMYSVKVGEIHVCADRPITDEERVRAIQHIIADIHIGTTPDGLDYIGKMNVEAVRLTRRQP
jgi:hypothetical protein